MIFKRKKKQIERLQNSFGKLNNRNAIRILQMNEYPESIINEAIDISKELDKNTTG